RDIAHGGQGITFVEHAVEYHGNDTVPKLSINWLTIVPLMHPVFHHCPSYSGIVNYNTASHTSFFIFLCPGGMMGSRMIMPLGAEWPQNTPIIRSRNPSDLV